MGLTVTESPLEKVKRIDLEFRLNAKNLRVRARLPRYSQSAIETNLARENRYELHRGFYVFLALSKEGKECKSLEEAEKLVSEMKYYALPDYVIEAFKELDAIQTKELSV